MLQTDALGLLGMIPGVVGVLAALVIPLVYRLKARESLVRRGRARLPADDASLGREWIYR